MNYNVNDIKKWLNFFNPEHFTNYDIDDFIDVLSGVKGFPEFNWEYGATKLCIIPEFEDYVIKIPFDGEVDYQGENFTYFYNGGGEEGWDYCALEDEYFVDTVLYSGYEKFFLTTDCITVNGWPIYIQEKVTVYKDSKNIPVPSKESVATVRKKSKMKNDVSLPTYWVAIALENFNNDIDALDDFLRFLYFNFTDLHSGNIGYKGKQVIILDYGGYNS